LLILMLFYRAAAADSRPGAKELPWEVVREQQKTNFESCKSILCPVYTF
jgi:hypothetical protein